MRTQLNYRLRIGAIAGTLAGVFALAGCGGGSGSDEFELAILHVNDHHSNLAPSSLTLSLQTSNTAGAARENVSVSSGGFARVASAMEELGARHSNVLKLHAGDAITGTLYYTLTQGQADAAMMNTVCFDAMAVGNHEFDSGDAGLRTFLNHLWSDPVCRTPLLSANLSPRPGSPLGNDIQPSLVVERGGQRIGIVGLTVAAKTQNSSRPDAGTVLLDERASAQTAIDALKAQGIDKIIVLSHLGYADEVELARQLSGVDVIVGGDSHSFLGDASLRQFNLSPVGEYPTRVTNADGDQACVVQAWDYSRAVGELTVRFDGRGRVQSCDGSPRVLIGDNFRKGNNPVSDSERAAILADLARQPALKIQAPSPLATSVLEPYSASLAEFSHETVTQAETTLCLRRVPGTQRDGSRSRFDACNSSPHVIAHGGDVQQLVAQAYLEQGQRFGGADLSIQNAGGVRIDLEAGPITVGDIYTVLPFANTLVRLDMSGAEVKSALEDAIEAVVARNSSGSYPYAGGLRWDVDLRAERGNRLSNLQLKNTAGQWVALDPAARYRVIVNDFIADGQDGYTTLGTIQGERREDTFLAYAEAFLTFAQENPLLRRLPSANYSTQRFIDTP